MSTTATQSMNSTITPSAIQSRSSVMLLSGANDGDGHWVTMDGEHVFIKGGRIAKGPSNLVGKKPSDLPDRSKPGSKVSDHEASYHGAVAANKAASGGATADELRARAKQHHVAIIAHGAAADKARAKGDLTELQHHHDEVDTHSKAIKKLNKMADDMDSKKKV